MVIKSNSDHDERGLLPYPAIVAATKGDPDAMKIVLNRYDSNIRYRLRMCIWKHWKTPQNRARNLKKLGVPRWAAYNIAYCGDRYARLAHNGWVQKAINNERLAAFGLVSMSNYYAEKRVIC